MENQVTFTTLVKEEVCSLNFEERELLSLVSAFCKVNGILAISKEGLKLILKTENSKIAKFIYSAFKTLFHVSPSYTYSKKMKLNKASVFQIIISENTTEILEKLEIMEDGMTSFPHVLVLEDRLRYFIAGAFLASGSVNSPHSKNYHLQMVVSSEEDGKYFLKLLNRFRTEKLEFKMIARRSKYVLYLKKVDQIATFLSLIFADSCRLELESERILKDFINSDNRLQICYNANYQKSVLKGEAQCKEITFLQENGSFNLLNEKEQKIAMIRLENPEASLVQIANLAYELYELQLSKSGVNHILSKIHDKYMEVDYDRNH